MAKRPKDPRQFIRAPGYEGGNEALDAFIKQNLSYPEEALKKRIEGVVKVEFDLNHKGKVVKTGTKSNLGHGCEEEAIRIVKLLRYSTLKHHGVKVTFHKTINIVFRLPPQTQQAQITYTFIPSKKEEQPVKKEKKVVGGYTITFKPKS